MKTNRTEFRLPFTGQWFVWNGGDTKELNNHHHQKDQRYSFDFCVLTDAGAKHESDGSRNEDYPCFGKEVTASADGTVIEAVDGVRDNEPHYANDISAAGNYVLIQHSESEFSLTGHLMLGSLAVHAGEKISSGQVLGRCGNSGWSTMPHLHFHVQDTPRFMRFDSDYEPSVHVTEGVKITFTDISIIRDGMKLAGKRLSPIKLDYIKPATS